MGGECTQQVSSVGEKGEEKPGKGKPDEVNSDGRARPWESIPSVTGLDNWVTSPHHSSDSS
jgi:hypothetical protein